MPVLVKRTRSESRRRSRTQRSAGVRRNSTSNARNKKLIRKGALQMHDGTEWASFDAYLRKNLQSKVELILFKKLKLDGKGREDRIVKLRLLLQQVVAMEKHLPPDDSGVHPIILFTLEARHNLGTMSEADREAWSKDLTQFTARDYFFAVTVPPQEAFLPQPPAGVARLHLNPHREVLLLTVTTGQASLPTMVKLWSFDSIQSFGATDSLLVIQTSSQTDAKDYCCFATSAAEEIADHLSQLVVPEENIYDTIDVESGSEDSSSSYNGSGDEAEGESCSVAEKDRGSPYRRSYLRAVRTERMALLDKDSELPKSDFPMLPLPTCKNIYATKWKLKKSPSISVTSDKGHSASSPTTQKGIISLTKNSPLLRRLLGSGERTAPTPEKALRPPTVGSPSDQLPSSPPLDELPRPRSPFMKLKRWLSPSRLSPKAAAAEIPSESLEQGASFVDSWEEGVLDRDTPAVSPLPSPFFRRRRCQQPVELAFHSESSWNTPTPPPPGGPLHWTVSSSGRTSPALTMASHSTLFDEDSRQGEEVRYAAGCPLVASDKESSTPEEALPNTVPALLAESGKNSGGLHSSGAVSPMDGIQQLSLQDKSEQQSLQDESKQTSLQADDEQQSLQDEREQQSLQDEREQQSLQDDSEQPSLQDEREQPSLQDEREQQSLQDEREQQSLQDEREQQSLQDDGEQPSLQDEREQQSLQDEREQQSLQDGREQQRLQDESEELSLQDEREHLRLQDESEKKNLQDTVLPEAQQVEHAKLTKQPSVSPQAVLTDRTDGTDAPDGTLTAESALPINEAIYVNSTYCSSPAHKPVGRVQSDNTFVHPELPGSRRRFSADGEQLALRTRSGSFSEMIQNIFVSSLDRPSSRLSDRCKSPLSVHSHSISDDSGQLETEVWPEVGTDLDALAFSSQSPSLHSSSTSQMTSFSLEGNQSSSDADTCLGVSAGNTYQFHGSLVRMRKVQRRTTDDSEALPSPPAAPRKVRGRSKSASHTLPRHTRSFLARPLPRTPIQPPPVVLVESSSEYVNTADLADSRYVNVTQDLLERLKIYDKIDFCSNLDGHYATLDFDALQFQEDGKSAMKAVPASKEEECIYAKVDIAAMEAARQLADQRRKEREVHSQSQTYLTEGVQQRRHASDFNMMQAGSSGTHRRLRAWSSVGIVNKERKTNTE